MTELDVSSRPGDTSPTEATVLRLVDISGSRPYRLARILLIPILRLLFRVEVRGRAWIPPAGPYIVAANHLNWLDAPLLLFVFPIAPRMNFVTDMTFVGTARFKWFIARLVGGILPVVEHTHASHAAMPALRDCLRRGGAVGIFPEGRYADSEGMMAPFHRGFAALALEARVPVVPVEVSGTKDLWFRKQVVVTIGEPIQPAAHTAESLVEITRTRIGSMHVPEPSPGGRRLLRRFLTRLFP